MNIGIDATNILSFGGGFVHLENILKYENHKKIDKIYIWSKKELIQKIKINNNKIYFKTSFFINFNIITRVLWQFYFLKKELKAHNCNLLFVLGGILSKQDIPSVSLIQNLLPFIDIKIFNYNILFRLKNYLLKKLHYLAIKKSNSIIFLTVFCKNLILKNIKKEISYEIIKHGVENIFRLKKKKFKNILKCNYKNKFKILYISKIENYKNHKNLILACKQLENLNCPISLTLFGVEKDKKMKNIEEFIVSNKCDKFVKVKKEVDYKQINKLYKNFDLHVYPSSCEAFGLIILETIASSTPIVCSNLGTFREILKKNTLYFNEKEINSIFLVMKKYIYNLYLRKKNTIKLYKESHKYSWEYTSKKTFNHLINVYKKFYKKKF